MSDLTELLAELKEIRQVLVPRRSKVVLLSNEGSGTPTNLVPSLTANYQDILKWLPNEPGGILKEMQLLGGLNILYKILIDDEVVANDFGFQVDSAYSLVTFDFKRKRVDPATKSGVLVQAKGLGSIIGSGTQVIIHGEQVIQW